MIGVGPGIGVSRPRGLYRAIQALFAAGEKGVWYDPSDLTTVFQDSAGTTAGVVGQPVGLMLDKSNGLALGAELVTNGTFDSGTGWTLAKVGVPPAGDASISGGALTVSWTDASNFSYATRNITVTAGKYYSVVASTTANIRVGITSGAVNFDVNALSGRGFILAAAGDTTLVITSSGGTAVIDSISVRELPGYHATQATSTARGTLGTSLVDMDGVDDSLSVATGAGGGSTGFFLCAGVRVDGGAGTNRVIYSDAGTNTGYILRINTSNQLELAAGNGTAYTLAATTDTLTAGPYVVTAWDDGTNLNVQVNSGTAGTAARPVVSAGNADFRISKDYGAATGYFNGAIYPYVYVRNGENVDANDRAAVKSYVAGKAGVSL